MMAAICFVSIGNPILSRPKLSWRKQKVGHRAHSAKRPARIFTHAGPYGTFPGYIVKPDRLARAWPCLGHALDRSCSWRRDLVEREAARLRSDLGHRDGGDRHDDGDRGK